MAEALKVGVRLDIGYDYEKGQRVDKAEVILLREGKAYKAEMEEINAQEKSELAKFEALSERAQLTALLPAKERREEMQKILNEIGSF
jgi:hypothetical protein